MFSVATARLSSELVDHCDSELLASKFVLVEQQCGVKFSKEERTFSVTGEWNAINNAHRLLQLALKGANGRTRLCGTGSGSAITHVTKKQKYFKTKGNPKRGRYKIGKDAYSLPEPDMFVQYQNQAYDRPEDLDIDTVLDNFEKNLISTNVTKEDLKKVLKKNKDQMGQPLYVHSTVPEGATVENKQIVELAVQDFNVNPEHEIEAAKLFPQNKSATCCTTNVCDTVTVCSNIVKGSSYSTNVNPAPDIMSCQEADTIPPKRYVPKFEYDASDTVERMDTDENAFKGNTSKTTLPKTYLSDTGLTHPLAVTDGNIPSGDNFSQEDVQFELSSHTGQLFSKTVCSGVSSLSSANSTIKMTPLKQPSHHQIIRKSAEMPTLPKRSEGMDDVGSSNTHPKSGATSKTRCSLNDCQDQVTDLQVSGIKSSSEGEIGATAADETRPRCSADEQKDTHKISVANNSKEKINNRTCNRMATKKSPLKKKTAQQRKLKSEKTSVTIKASTGDQKKTSATGNRRKNSGKTKTCTDVESSLPSETRQSVMHTKQTLQSNTGGVDSDTDECVTKSVFKCTECDYQGHQKKRLTEHMGRVHGLLTDNCRGSVQDFQCQQCDKTFVFGKDLSRHKKIVHNSDRFFCEICNKVYKSRYVFKKHQMRHSEGYVQPMFKCQLCEREFTTKFSLGCHLKSQHLELRKTYSCPLCGKTFRQLRSYRQHANVHAGIRPYRCEICSQTFTYDKSLKEHRYMHDNLRRFPCTICNKAFRQKTCLLIHMKVHSDKKDHICRYCARAFTQKQSMLRHERIHTGDRPYECITCHKKFNDLSVIRKHIMMAHKIDKWRMHVLKETTQPSEHFISGGPGYTLRQSRIPCIKNTPAVMPPSTHGGSTILSDVSQAQSVVQYHTPSQIGSEQTVHDPRHIYQKSLDTHVNKDILGANGESTTPVMYNQLTDTPVIHTALSCCNSNDLRMPMSSLTSKKIDGVVSAAPPIPHTFHGTSSHSSLHDYEPGISAAGTLQYQNIGEDNLDTMALPTYSKASINIDPTNRGSPPSYIQDRAYNQTLPQHIYTGSSTVSVPSTSAETSLSSVPIAWSVPPYSGDYSQYQHNK